MKHTAKRNLKVSAVNCFSSVEYFMASYIEYLDRVRR